MDYIERVLQKSTALWRAREENLQKRLALLRGKTGAAESEGKTLSPPTPPAEESAEKKKLDAAAKRDVSGEETATADSDAGADDAAGYRARLLQKLTGKEEAKTARAAGGSMGSLLPVDMAGEETLHAAAGGTPRYGEAEAVLRATERGTDWLSKRLGEGKTEGLSGERAHERIVELERARTLAGTEVFSKSLERDARRYDGGFLLY